MSGGPEATLHVRESLRLSQTQEQMLLFFTGQRDDPYGNTPTIDALIARDLLVQDAGTGRCQVTGLGQQVADALTRDQLGPVRASGAAGSLS